MIHFYNRTRIQNNAGTDEDNINQEDDNLRRNIWGTYLIKAQDILLGRFDASFLQNDVLLYKKDVRIIGKSITPKIATTTDYDDLD